jgi:hypothetical protein
MNSGTARVVLQPVATGQLINLGGPGGVGDFTLLDSFDGIETLVQKKIVVAGADGKSDVMVEDASGNREPRMDTDEHTDQDMQNPHDSTH